MKTAYLVLGFFLCTKLIRSAETMFWAQKLGAKFKNDVTTEKHSILPGRRFGLPSKLVVNLSAALKGASTSGLPKRNKDWSMLVMTKKTSTPIKSKIQWKNHERGVLQSSALKVALNHHKPRTENLRAGPPKTNVVNVEMLDITLQLVRNEGGYGTVRRFSLFFLVSLSLPTLLTLIAASIHHRHLLSLSLPPLL